MSAREYCKGWTGAALVLLSWMGMQPAVAEPYLAVRQDLKCNGCHVNPTGGGLRNDFGMAFSQHVLPARPAAGEGWTGKVGELLRLGGDLRTGWSDTRVPDQGSRRRFDLDEVRLYADFTLLADRLGVYLDQRVAPGAAQTQEAYVRYGDTIGGWYVKGGKFYLPFGWRLEDDSAFVRQATGINMAAPDTGVELGFERGPWSAQLALTQGSGNAQADSGHQVVGQAVWVQPLWRLGAAASFTESDLGDRRMAGVFAGVHTGPVSWLGEVDFIRDEGFLPQAREFAAVIGEMNWMVRGGHNLKLTAEFYDADRDVDENEQNRWSVVYEVTPLPFVQVRVGHRRYDGIPQSSLQNRRMTFVELHGFF
jgi:hypothetical protein